MVDHHFSPPFGIFKKVFQTLEQIQLLECCLLLNICLHTLCFDLIKPLWTRRLACLFAEQRFFIGSVDVKLLHKSKQGHIK